MNFSFLPLIFIVFLVLKLTGIITWSWWLITAPLWIGFVIWCVLVVALFIFAVTQAKKPLTDKEKILARIRRGRF